MEASLGQDVSAEPGTGLAAAVYFWMNQGMEVPFAGTVKAAAMSATTISADQFNAPRFQTLQSSWDSGKPGKKLILSLMGFPTGWAEQIRGRSDYPADGNWTDMAQFTVQSSDITKPIVIPKTAKPGYFYWIAVDHTDGTAQPASALPGVLLNPSRTSVSPGGTIRLTGVVPVKGHMGTGGARPSPSSSTRFL